MTDQINKPEQAKQEAKSPKRDYIFAVGRRKASTAQVRLYKKDVLVWGTTSVKKGEFVVNNKPALEYFGKRFDKIFLQPLRSTNMQDKLAVSAKVMGGGKIGQLAAMVLALARGLDKIDREKFHPILKKQGFLTRDARIRQRRKVGMGGKSRRKKQSPKR